MKFKAAIAYSAFMTSMFVVSAMTLIPPNFATLYFILLYGSWICGTTFFAFYEP